MHRLPLSPALVLAASFLLGATACGDLSTELAERPQPGGAFADHTPPASPAGVVGITVLPDYTALDGASATANSGSLVLAIDAGGAVPRFPDPYIESVAVFGYAWVNAALSGIVAVIHPAIPKDSHQNPNGWHTHLVQLGGGTATSDLCVVSLGGSQMGITIKDDRLEVRAAVRSVQIAASDFAVAAAFIVQGDAGCSGSGLGVKLLDTEAL